MTTRHAASGIDKFATLDTAQTFSGVKRFPPGTLLMQNAAGTLTAEPYSDVNPPDTLNLTDMPTLPATPPAGQSTLYTPDGKSIRLLDSDATDVLIGPGLTTAQVDARVRGSVRAETATVTLALTDENTTIYNNTTTPIGFNIPTQATVAWDVGAQITFVQRSTGTIQIAPLSGVTIYALNSQIITAGSGSVLVLKNLGTNVWVVSGDLPPTSVGANFSNAGYADVAAAQRAPAAANNLHLTLIQVPFTCTCTGVRYRKGTGVTASNVQLGIWSQDGATRRAITASTAAGTTASILRSIPWTAPVTLTPGAYWVGLQAAATTTDFYGWAANEYFGPGYIAAPASFVLPTALSPAATALTAEAPALMPHLALY